MVNVAISTLDSFVYPEDHDHNPFVGDHLYRIQLTGQLFYRYYAFYHYDGLGLGEDCPHFQSRIAFDDENWEQTYGYDGGRQGVTEKDLFSKTTFNYFSKRIDYLLFPKSFW